MDGVSSGIPNAPYSLSGVSDRIGALHANMAEQILMMRVNMIFSSCSIVTRTERVTPAQ
jgi:hypothetical protein